MALSQFLKGVGLDEWDVVGDPKLVPGQSPGQRAVEPKWEGRRLTDGEFVQKSLEENQFWLRIMMEHALFLRLGLPPDATRLINQAKRFEQAFEKQLERSFSIPAEPEPLRSLNDDSLFLTGQMVLYKQRVLSRVLTGTVRGFNFPLLLEHVRREAIYFFRTLQRVRARVERPLDDDIIEENVFFLRIMADHAKFVAHLLDPTEKELIRQASALGQEFDVLAAQARNLDFEPRSNHVLRAQLTVFKGSTLNLRSFKEQATKLVQASQIRSVIDPRLASHITREAAKFLSIIDQLEERSDRETAQGGVSVEPATIVSGQPVTITYKGLLASAGARTVYLHVGYGENGRDWSGVTDLEMKRAGDGWKVTFQTQEASKLNFCFKDDAGNWDSNSGRNWSYDMYSGAAVEAPATHH